MDQERTAPTLVGRYAIYDAIAAGGMASVHLARLGAKGGFKRTVAIKRMHKQFAADPEFVAMFLDEARLAARIRHPNVVPTLDVVALDGELFLVMEYVEGESLAHLLRAAREAREPPSLPIVAGIFVGVLQGLHAAHEAKSDQGTPLGIVHRDVSPQNILVGTDGIARMIDFGVAKALTQVHTTREGQLKGKLAYMAPERLLGETTTRQTDIFAMAVVLWEALVGKRLFVANSLVEAVLKIVDTPVVRPSSLVPGLPAALDDVVMRGLERDVTKRWMTAMDMVEALEATTQPATSRAIGQWVQTLAPNRLATRAHLVARIESDHSVEPRTSEPPRGEIIATPIPEVPIDVEFDAHTQAPASLSIPTTVERGLVTPPRRRRLRAAAWSAGILACCIVVVAWFSFGTASQDSTRAATSAPPNATSSAAPAPAPEASATTAPAERPPIPSSQPPVASPTPRAPPARPTARPAAPAPTPRTTTPGSLYSRD